MDENVKIISVTNDRITHRKFPILLVCNSILHPLLSTKKKKKLKSHDGIPLKIERKSIVMELKHGIINHFHVYPTPHPYSNNLRYFLCSFATRKCSKQILYRFTVMLCKIQYFFYLFKLNNSPVEKKEK